MKRGYRLSKAHALANYYADVDNYANFGLGTQLKQAGQYVSNLPGYVDDGFRSLGRGIGSLGVGGGSIMSKIGDMGAARGVRKAAGDSQIAALRDYAGQQELRAAKGSMKARRNQMAAQNEVATRLGNYTSAGRQKATTVGERALGYGGAALGTGALGAAGYAGYRALNGNDDEE